MHWPNRSYKPLSLFSILFTLLGLLSVTKAVDITLSVSFSPFAHSISQTCNSIQHGICCDGFGPAHLGSRWAGIIVSGLPAYAVASAFHAAVQPDGSYYGGCSGPRIGVGVGPGTWQWGRPHGYPRTHLPLSGGMWVDQAALGAQSGQPIEKPGNSSSSMSSLSLQYRSNENLWMKRSASSTAAMPSVLPDIIVVDGNSYTNVQKEGLYRDEYGRSFNRQQITRAAYLNWAKTFRKGNQLRTNSATELENNNEAG